MLKTLLLLSLSNFVFQTEGKLLTKVERAGETVKAHAFREENDSEILCSLLYTNSYSTVGWDIMEVQTNPKHQSDLEQVECAGLLEGLVTYEAIYINYYNNIKQYCKGKEATCAKLYTFLNTHQAWIRKQIRLNAKLDPTWHQVKMFYGHLKALQKGYTLGQTDSAKALTLMDFIMMNLQDDTDDVISALEGDISAKVKGHSHCSAIIKLLPDNQDLMVGHNTWTEYVQMYRMLKKYDIPIHTGHHSQMTVPGRVISFSGYPGVITSGDDFYVLSSKLVALETTIGNSNATLWQYVTPTGQLFESVRSLIAMRLANNGRSWCEAFADYNSGTYNNEWMIVDFNKYKKGKQPEEGTLFILEQIPGYIRFEDQTPVLLDHLYWASYNVPYYPDVFAMSGNQQLVDEYGDWFSYNNTARANLFRRDHSNVTDLNSLLALLRSNNYKHDEYSKCNCTPPYSAENALAARSDLNPKTGKYPFSALGHRPHGAIDAKVISSGLVKNHTFLAVCGPTTGSNLPAFEWNKSNFKYLPHMGQPNSFTNFTPMYTPWEMT